MSFNKLKKIISIVCASKISIKYALAKLHIINYALSGRKNPINCFLSKYKNNLYFKDVVTGIRKVKRFKSISHTAVVKKLGISCRYPGTFDSSIHAIITSTSYKSAVIKTIKAGGCNCSRANFVGAYFSALKGIKNIPTQWINKTKPAKSIIK